MNGCTPSAAILSNTIWWSTWSITKSTNATLVIFWLSAAWWQVCKIFTSSWVIERPFTAPIWWSSNLLEISSNIQPPINVSSILLKVGVNEIGRISFSIKVGDLGNMTTLSRIFQMRETSPDCIDELNMWHMGSESANAKSRRIQFGILSGPKVFRILMRESLWKTSYGCISLCTYHDSYCPLQSRSWAVVKLDQMQLFEVIRLFFGLRYHDLHPLAGWRVWLI